QVERERFDQMLLEQSKAKVHFGRTATGVIREEGKVAGVKHAEGEARARFVVMATGPGKTARYLRQSAIFGYWKNSKHPEGSQANDTIIESFPDGWVWSLRLASDLRNVTVLFDKPGTSYEESIKQTSFVRGLLEGAELAGKPLGCDASWQCADTFAEPRMLLVGDAGAVIDPLSSQGVYKALSSAMSAAIVINTCLKKPELESAALDFFNDEERRTYDGYAAGSVATFRSEQRWPERPFWKTRHELSVWDAQAQAFDKDIANSIEAGRAGELRLCNSATSRIAKRPTMSGQFIELADYIVTSRFEYGYRGPHAQTILDIHRSLGKPRHVTEILEENKRYEAGILLKVLSYMYKEGLVESA
ncbi:MAG: tryptophan 7-halogenase, partial [Acidobacteria bacterium]|nr:tryptophan 7-halogenase [Acidobacteriota bacterium]